MSHAQSNAHDANACALMNQQTAEIAHNCDMSALTEQQRIRYLHMLAANSHLNAASMSHAAETSAAVSIDAAEDHMHVLRSMRDDA